MAALLKSVERFLERAFEAPARRLFCPPLQPVELSAALLRAMATDGQIWADGLQVPNTYRVCLHPLDFEGVAAWRTTLEEELAQQLFQRATERRWRCPGRPRVHLVADAAVSRGRPRVITSTTDPAPPVAGAAPATLPPGAWGSTGILEVAPAPRGTRPPSGEAWLELPGAQCVMLGDGIVRLGRASDNDVVIEDPRISRYHADVQRQAAGFVLRDLGSSNGTRVGERPVQEHVLRSGDVIHLAGVPVRFHGP